MTVAQKQDLQQRIFAILHEHNKPLRVPEIEVFLKVAGDWTADTFDVRDAVSALIANGRAEFVHPGYLVRVVEPK